MIAGSSLFFPRIQIKYVVFMSLWPRTIRILISNWPRKRKFIQFFLKVKAGEDLILPWSRVGHALRPIFILWLVKIWQVSSCEKIMQHLENCLLSQLKLKSFVSTCDVFNCRFLLDDKMKYSCYQQSSLIHGWFVYWIFGREMRRLPKLEIRFRMHPVSYTHLTLPTIYSV